ncbi:hypothetical protein IWX48DRAFT_389205 [Phyllosticta citricarpa]
MNESTTLKRKRPSELGSHEGQSESEPQNKKLPSVSSEKVQSASVNRDKSKPQDEESAHKTGSPESVQSSASQPDIPEFFRPINYWRRHHRWPSYRCSGDERPLNDLQDLKVPDTTDTENEDDSKESCVSILPGYRVRKSEVHFTTVDDIPTEVLYKNQMLDAGNVAHSTAKNVWLEDQEIYSRDGLSDTSAALCQRLLQSKEPTPVGTLFDDEPYKKICKELKDEGKNKLVRHVGFLLVPSVAELRARGDTGLEILTETVGETWRRCIPVFPPSPSPDFSVGFYREAVGKERVAKLWPYLGTAPETSPFAATTNMLFPFLVVEAIGTCPSENLNATTAKRQSTHSAIIGMRSVIELFRYVNRTHEINGEILTFSVTYDTTSIHIYGHYAEISGKSVDFRRHEILRHCLYKDWAPQQFQRICSAIDDLPSWNVFRVSKSLPGSQSSPHVDEKKELFAKIWPSFLKDGNYD